MKTNIKILLISLVAYVFSSCSDERALVIAPENFEVKVTDQLKVITDTFVVNVNEKITFNFPNGCPDEILFYSGESAKEYRFADRSLYNAAAVTLFESKVTVNTTINSFDAAISKDYSLVAISGLSKYTSDEFNKSTKTELIKLRASSTAATAVADNFSITSVSSPINLSVGDLNLAILAKSADATKNMLSIATTGVVVTNTETRNYGFVKNGITVANLKTVTYPIVSNLFKDAAWAQFAPDSTIAPGTSVKVANALGYSWNTGEIGVSYAPAITGGAVSVNKNAVALAVNYPLSVSTPLDATKVVAAGVSPSEASLVSRGLNPAAVIPDAAIIVKKVDQSSMLYYQYIYKERGVYKVSVVGINVGTNGTSKVVREFVILVKNSADNI